VAIKSTQCFRRSEDELGILLIRLTPRTRKDGVFYLVSLLMTVTFIA